MMAKKKCIVFLSLVFVLGLVGQAMAAFTLDWFAMNYRRYEDGRKFNRIGFEIKNAQGRYVTADRLTSVTLTTPDGKTYNKDQLGLVFEVYTYLDGEYDGRNGVFVLYGFNGTKAPYTLSDYYGVVPGKLVTGTYHLSILYAGELLEKDFTFNGQVNIPIISASSIKTSIDGSGNLTATWTVSASLMSLCATRPTLQTSVRAFIDVYQDEDPQLKAELVFRIPTHMGRWFVPKARLDWLKSKGNKYTIGVQLRTNDNCNRTYSKKKIISLSSAAQDLGMESEESTESGEN